MCRNIKTLYNFAPPATKAEIEAAARQYVRKISGFQQPSQVNQSAFDQAIADVTDISARLLNSLVTKAEPRDREVEAQRAQERARQRFGLA